MDEVLTIAEMKSRYPSEWVLVEDPVTDDSLEVLSGKVLCHSPDRDVFDRKVMELRPRHSAFLYFGDVVPNGMEAIL
jgi:hypothetical protein